MAASADPHRFTALLHEHRRVLFKVANAWCANRDDRHDLIQDMLVQLWRAWPRYDGRTRYVTWMYRIAMNVAISSSRGDRRRVAEAVPLDELGLDEAGRVYDDASDDVHALHQMIGQLDPVNRAVILLWLEGFPHDEIGETLGISAGNAATRVERIKRRLRRDYAADTDRAPS